ncbi:heme ABC transporter ATP-binding protein [Pedobacter deserti]|uniref:heme ABC transporter ATP-binding protein n=1 Tax=Pedobacter deserti TaxID=2817382 RepID=UPI00210D00CD|nr:heme ABC transporter ATP-binding protein [Pedobacter sp. SYSU D00382]
MLIAQALSYHIGKRPLLRNVSFSLRSGEMLAILGANGAGKSTLLKMLSGEKTPSEGQITLHEKNLAEYKSVELARNRAVLNQQNFVSMAFTAEEIVSMGRYPHRGQTTAAQDRNICSQVMELTGTTVLAERSYLTLSGGEQQRVQLARVLAQIWDVPGALLIMDEPVASLDLQYQQQTLAIAKMLSRKGYMVITVLHDINLAAQYADRILMLKNGRKWYDGSAAEILSSKNIYEVFEISADIITQPSTLRPVFLPHEVLIELGQ